MSVDRVDTVEDRVARARLAHAEGAIALHGTAIANSSAVCLVGPSTAGKSTLAAFLVGKRGLALLAEGMVVVALDGNAPVAHPGPHVFRLWADVIQRLGEDPTAFRQVDAAIPKRIYPAVRVVAESKPLSAIYVLCDGDTDKLSQLHGAEAAVALLRNLYLEGQLDVPQLADALTRCARIADTTRVCRLSRRKSPVTLMALVDMIAEDAGL